MRRLVPGWVGRYTSRGTVALPRLYGYIMTKEDYIRLIILALALLGIQASPELTQMITDLVNLAYEIVCQLN